MPGDDGVVIAWRGYLFGLVEWGVIDIPTHARLVKLLPEGIGIEETEIMMIGIDEN